MKATHEWFGDYEEAERAADLYAGDNPGLVVWLIEAWESLAGFEDGDDGDLYVLTAESVRDGIYRANRDFPYWDEKYDATKAPLNG